MPRDSRVAHVARLRRERRTRAPGRFYGTRATPYGDVLHGPRARDAGRTLLALILLAALVAVMAALADHLLHAALLPMAAWAPS